MRNKIPESVFCAFFIFSVYGCDPARYLSMRCGKDPKSSLSVYCNKQFISRWNNDTGKTAIHLPIIIGGNIKRDTVFFFGIGTWQNDSLIPQYAKNVDSIVFINDKSCTVIRQQSEISKYLLRHRKGAMKQILEISAD